MEYEIQLTQEEVAKARDFHLQHFPGQDVPDLPAVQPNSVEEPAEPASTDPGYYSDGVRRTLTDEQIALFRHSEIQRLLTERTRREEAEEDNRKRGEMRQHTRRKHKESEKSEPSRYDNDTTVHSRSDVAELSYEEGGSSQHDGRPTKFQWPFLGS